MSLKKKKNPSFSIHILIMDIKFESIENLSCVTHLEINPVSVKYSFTKFWPYYTLSKFTYIGRISG